MFTQVGVVIGTNNQSIYPQMTVSNEETYYEYLVEIQKQILQNSYYVYVCGRFIFSTTQGFMSQKKIGIKKELS